MKKTIGLAVLSVAVFVTGFGLLLFAAPWGESSATAKANFCDSMSNLATTVESYQGLNPVTATTDELESAADDINDAYNDVVNDAYDWAYAYDNELTEAYDDLYYAIQDLPGDYTIAESIEALDEELNALPQAYADTFDGSGCSTV